MRSKFMLAVAISLAQILAANDCCADVFIEHVFPPSVRRGEVTRVTIVGSDLQSATDLWSTLSNAAVKMTLVSVESKGRVAVFDVAVSQAARLGMYGLRVATLDGFSNAHLFAIDDLPNVVELESHDKSKSNSSFADAQPVALPAAVVGTSPASDIDHFAITVKAGQRVSFDVVGSRLGKGFDPVITILDTDGKLVVERDNDVGLFFDNRFAHTFKKAGRYVVRLRDTRYRGSEHWTYMLRMGRFPIARVAIPSTVRLGEQTSITFPELEPSSPAVRNSRAAFRRITLPTTTHADRFFFSVRGEQDDGSVWLPLTVSDLPNAVEAEPNATAEQASVVTVPSNLHGVIDRPGDEDWFAFDLKKKDRLVLRTETRGMGSPADLELTLIAPDGKEVRRGDDSGFEDAAFEISAPKEGTYRLHVREVVRQGGPAYAYRIEVKRRQPAIRLQSEIGRMAVPRGTWQPLPLLLSRTDYNGPVELSLIGAPAGMSLVKTTIGAGINELTGMLAVDTSVQPGVYTLQVVGKGTVNDVELTGIARTQPLIDRNPTGRGPHGEAFELREDQRRLPPSLQDRIAVVVLPESPFDFEITTPLVTLPRYVNTTFNIQTQFTNGFAGPVTYVARGGTLEPNRLQKPPVVSQIPVATADRSSVIGTLTSGVNSNTVKHRVTVTGTAKHEGRTIHLTRTFQLELKVAFSPAVEKTQIELAAGQSAKLRISANRLAPYTGSFTIAPVAPEQLQVPASITFAEDQPQAEFIVKVADDAKPGKYTIKLPASTRIGKFAESADGGTVQVVVTGK